jgi:hypothetical protein
MRVFSLVGVALVGVVSGSALAQTTLFGPSAYLSVADSPFATDPGLLVETFEDGLFNLPGVSAVPGASTFTPIVSGPGSFTDSVDADDGLIDGNGSGGHSLSFSPNSPNEQFGVSIVFDPLVIGGFPTRVGFVWTDGSNVGAAKIVTFFGPAGELLGEIGPVSIGDGLFSGTTAEDRFFGAESSVGISRIFFRSPTSGNNFELDHLQYVAVPEPATLAGLAGLAVIALRRRPARG